MVDRADENVVRAARSSGSHPPGLESAEMKSSPVRRDVREEHGT
jgi:hypothetical protein